MVCQFALRLKKRLCRRRFIIAHSQPTGENIWLPPFTSGLVSDQSLVIISAIVSSNDGHLEDKLEHFLCVCVF